MRPRKWVGIFGVPLVAGLLGIAQLSVAAAPTARRAVPGAQVGFWAGETGSVAAYSPAIWRLLARTRTPLYMDVGYEKDFGPVPAGKALSVVNLRLIEHANRLGVPVNAWLTLPVAEGTFADEQNAAVVLAAVKSLDHWINLHRLDVGETVLDLEQATGYQPVTDALAGDLGTLEQTAHANIDPSAQCRSMVTYRRTISWAHRHGMRLAGTPVPFSIDDYVDDHNMGLSNLLSIPPYAPGMYDEIYLQAYRAEFGVDLGSAYIVRYYRLMQHYFGRIGQVTLGNTGDPPYTAVGPLLTDIRMLAGLGATQVPLFDFDSAVKDYGVSGIAALIAAGHQPLAGPGLATAEHSSTESAVQGAGAVKAFGALNEAANAATLAVTAAGANPRQPNAWPDGCGAMRPAPLRGQGMGR